MYYLLLIYLKLKYLTDFQFIKRELNLSICFYITYIKVFQFFDIFSRILKEIKSIIYNVFNSNSYLNQITKHNINLKI
jgi:hypothetical protein